MPESAQTSRSTRPSGGGDDGACVEAGRAVQSSGGGEHHGVKDRRRSGDAGGRLERRAIEVPDPDADGHVARIADGPVVVIRLRRPGLDGYRERKLQAPATPEDVLPRAVVGEHVGNPVRGERRDERPARAIPGVHRGECGRADQDRLEPLAASSKRRVGSHELVEAHFGVAERQAEAVVGRRPVEGRESSAREESLERGHAKIGGEHDGRHVLGSRQRATREQRTTIAAVVVARAVEDAFLGGREMRRHIGQHARRREPGLEGECIGEGLERGPGLAWRERPVDRATVLGVRVVPGSFPSEPFSARIVENYDRHIRGTVTIERLPMAPDDADDIALQSGIERGLDSRPAGSFRTRQSTISTKCGARNGVVLRENRRRSSLRLAGAIRRQSAGRLHAAEHRPLPRERLGAVAKRVVAGRPLRQPGKKRRLRRG